MELANRRVQLNYAAMASSVLMDYVLLVQPELGFGLDMETPSHKDTALLLTAALAFTALAVFELHVLVGLQFCISQFPSNKI
jgi:hypothetical protein